MSDDILCTNCHFPNENDSNFCDQCGTPLAKPKRNSKHKEHANTDYVKTTDIQQESSYVKTTLIPGWIVMAIGILGVILGAPFRSHGEMGWILGGAIGVVLVGLYIFGLYVHWQSFKLRTNLPKPIKILNKLSFCVYVAIFAITGCYFGFAVNQDQNQMAIVIFLSGLGVSVLWAMLVKWIIWLAS